MKKKKSAGARLPTGREPTPPPQQQKLSEIIKQMAMRLIKHPEGVCSEPAMVVTTMLAAAAWNSALGDNAMRDQHRKVLEKIDRRTPVPWAELRADDTERLIAELVEYKRAHHPADLRRIVAAEVSRVKQDEAGIRIHWTEPQRVVRAEFARARDERAPGKAGRGQAIADRLVRKMRQYVQAKVVDLNAVLAGKKHAEALQKTVATAEDLADLHPAHAIYVYAQNQVSVMSEQLTALREMNRFTRLIARAEDEYLPGGPPMSPLTTSFFTCWAFFDARVGLAQETIGSITMAIGSAFGMHPELLGVIGLLQKSRMGVYIHEGVDQDVVTLRELVTDRICRAISPSGYRGQKGQLWYARVLPPPLDGLAEHVVLTTPYVLVMPREYEWQQYFRRVLPDAPLQARREAYERHMKFGPSTAYWNEFVFEAYVNHNSDVIFLAGLPDVPESRPHSRVNERRRSIWD